MKMTRMKDPGLLSSEASGNGIDLNGPDISGTADAAFYRLDTVPGSVLTLPDIGSSTSLMVQPTMIKQQQPIPPAVDSTDDTGSTEAVDSTEQTDPADNRCL